MRCLAPREQPQASSLATAKRAAAADRGATEVASSKYRQQASNLIPSHAAAFQSETTVEAGPRALLILDSEERPSTAAHDLRHRQRGRSQGHSSRPRKGALLDLNAASGQH